MNNTKSPSRRERSFGPLRDKTLRSMIRRKFITEYGFSDAVPVAEFITDDLMTLIDLVCPPLERVKPGQMVWMGVPKDLPRNQIGQRLRDLPLKPILLTVLTEDDINDHIAARGRDGYLAMRRRRTARMFDEADMQETTLPYTDVAAFFGLSEDIVGRDVQSLAEGTREGTASPRTGSRYGADHQPQGADHRTHSARSSDSRCGAGTRPLDSRRRMLLRRLQCSGDRLWNHR